MGRYFQFLLAAMADWGNHSQQDVTDYLRAESRIFQDQLGVRRPRLSDSERRLPAVVTKKVGHKWLFGLGTVVTPDTPLRWYRRLVAQGAS